MKIMVFSLGGSLIVPDAIDTSFLKDFRQLILDFVAEGNKAIIICGGGSLCRKYNDAARDIIAVKDIDLDWMGIAMTRVNAELVRSIFGDSAYQYIIKDPTKDITTEKKIIVGGGYTPGNSSDKVAVMLADKLGAGTVINMTNIDKVYDSDPKIHKGAKPLDEISWDDFLGIIGDGWVPGKNVPFDPVASRLAKDKRIRVAILNGKRLDNLKAFISGKDFDGTMIGQP